MNADPQQRRFAPLLWAGYAQRWASLAARYDEVGKPKLVAKVATSPRLFDE
jgi:hypothetical protein